MWEKTYSKTFQDVKKEDIWRIWTDVNNWPQWHDDLEYCKLEGSFEVGAYFMLKPKGIKAIKIMLTAIEKGFSFTDCTTFFGAKMYNIHTLEETAQGLKLTNTMIVSGPLSWLWVKLVAQNVANTIPHEMEELVKLARRHNG